MVRLLLSALPGYLQNYVLRSHIPVATQGPHVEIAHQSQCSHYRILQPLPLSTTSFRAFLPPQNGLDRLGNRQFPSEPCTLNINHGVHGSAQPLCLNYLQCAFLKS